MKLTIFEYRCMSYGVDKDAQPQALQLMLRGPGLNYFYTAILPAIRRHNIDISTAIGMIRNYFEGPEYSREIGRRWNDANLLVTMLNGLCNKRVVLAVTAYRKAKQFQSLHIAALPSIPSC